MAIQNSSINDEYIITPTCHQFSSQIEIDTVRLFISWQYLQNFDFDSFLKKVGAENCRIGHKANYKGFNILKSDKGITITGSLSNYYVGHYNTLPYSEIYNVVEKLGNELGLNLHNSRYRVDTNFNTITDNLGTSYTKHLFTHMPRYKRLEQVDGVLFETNSKAFQFYNKSTHLEETRGVVTDDWLRFEFRILNDVKKHTGMVYMKDLCKLSNYHRLLELFLKHYKLIKKQRVYLNDSSSILNPKNYINNLLIKGVKSKGGEAEIWRNIEQMDALKLFNNRQQKSRLKGKINRILNSKGQTIVNPLVEELNTKFFNAIQAEKEKYSSL